MKERMIVVVMLIVVFLPCSTMAQPTPIEEKVAVLVTGWGMPAGYSFDYSWYSSEYARCGDKTEYEGQPCQFGHIGEFPYQAHMNIIPWSICFETPGRELLYDNSGIYILEGGVYVSPNPAIPSVLPGDIPLGVPITPLVELTDHTGKLSLPRDPRNGEDYLDGWYKIGDTNNSFTNGYRDLDEQSPAYYVRYYGHITGPTDPPEAYEQNVYVQAMESYTEDMLYEAFGDRIDVRPGYYSHVPGYSDFFWDVAEDFANEGFTKMLLARETTDYNNYALNFFTLNYTKERLCEIDKLDDIEIFMTRQIGRTPEFNTMNIMNMKPFIEAYPEGSTIAIVYATRGLPWGEDETPGWFGRAQPWSKEIYFENAYLNYLSWKKAIEKAYGHRYDLVFTKGKVESNLRDDNLFTFGLIEDTALLGYGGETLYYGLRDAIQFAKADGIDKIIIAPCHWQYDNLDTILGMKVLSGLPLTPKADLWAGIFEMTHCEDSDVNEVACGSPESVAEITVAPSYSHKELEFATSYYVVLQGTLEQFGLFPEEEEPVIEASQLVTKLNGGTVEVTSGSTQGAKIEIPGDPYPNWPQDFTPETAIPVNDPEDTNDCMWSDTEISIGHRANPPSMNSLQPVGPAVHFGPYRTFFNRNVTVTVPYDGASAGDQVVRVYIFNHVTQDWDEMTPASVDEMNNLVTFETQVLGLFQVAAGDTDGDGIPDSEDNCPEDSNPGQENSDNDSHGNACDNCPNADNEDQADSDGDRIGDVCDTAEAAIPTLSEWGMIIFMMIMLGIGVAALVRRRMV